LNELEIKKFIGENEEFLEDYHQKEGRTNLGNYYLKYRQEKLQQTTNNATENIMVPPDPQPAQAINPETAEQPQQPAIVAPTVEASQPAPNLAEQQAVA